MNTEHAGMVMARNMYAFISKRMWLDDVRPAPAGWVWVKSYEEAIAYLQENDVEEISLDYDLGLVQTAVTESGLVIAEEHSVKTGLDVVLWIETAVREGRIPLPIIHCHSANPVGKQRIKEVIQRLKEGNDDTQHHARKDEIEDQ